jgi:hypothetical protein
VGHGLLSNSEHRRLGKALFNHVWDLMETRHRTPEEDAEMIMDVQAMRFHWFEAGDLANKSTAEWQTARVYSILGLGESALYHAKRSVMLAESGGSGVRDFNLPSAYEGLARAFVTLGERRQAKLALAKAKKLAASIKDVGDRRTIRRQIAVVEATLNGP